MNLRIDAKLRGFDLPESSDEPEQRFTPEQQRAMEQALIDAQQRKRREMAHG